MSMCTAMVFAAMLEFAIVNTLARKEIRQMSQRNECQDEQKADTVLHRRPFNVLSIFIFTFEGLGGRKIQVTFHGIQEKSKNWYKKDKKSV